jgi:hypothetical protein
MSRVFYPDQSRAHQVRLTRVFPNQKYAVKETPARRYIGEFFGVPQLDGDA